MNVFPYHDDSKPIIKVMAVLHHLTKLRLMLIKHELLEPFIVIQSNSPFID